MSWQKSLRLNLMINYKIKSSPQTVGSFCIILKVNSTAVSKVWFKTYTKAHSTAVRKVFAKLSSESGVKLTQ